MDSSKAILPEAAAPRLQPVALSCVLNIGACKLKLSDWQGAVDSCLEVSLLVSGFVNLWDLDLFIHLDIPHHAG